MNNKLLGIKIDYIRMYQAVEIIDKWIEGAGKHYVVTPNPEMLVDARFDDDFKKALNEAELSIPDSLRLGWGTYVTQIKNPFLRLFYGSWFMFPHLLPRFSYPTTTGVDLMETILSLSEDKGYTTAYLGGSKKVADKLFKCLKLKYPKLKIAFCSGNMFVNFNGEMQFDSQSSKKSLSKSIKDIHRPVILVNAHEMIQKIDIMFVAFGHRKQEKWMHKNLPKLNTKIMVGVGGAFDYLSGSVPRAPMLMRKLGLEWLFRVSVQPWRIKRFWKLLYFVYLVLMKK